MQKNKDRFVSLADSRKSVLEKVKGNQKVKRVIEKSAKKKVKE